MDIGKLLRAFEPVTEKDLRQTESTFANGESGRLLGPMKDVNFRRLYALYVREDTHTFDVEDALNRSRRSPSPKAFLKLRILEERRETIAYALRYAFLDRFGSRLSDEEWMNTSSAWVVRQNWNVWWDAAANTEAFEQRFAEVFRSGIPVSLLHH